MGVDKDINIDFKYQFYNLQGAVISERKKNLSKLLKSTSQDVPQDQIDFEPRNYQESIFYVDVLIHFRQVDKLIEILKGGSEILSSKILKQQWFFKEAFKDMDENEIVNIFLPMLSYSLRMKVLKKLSLILGEERMDKIFDLLLERYGLFIAKQFLFGCSSEKIISILRNNEITLSSEQLKRLLQKDGHILKVYFEEYKRNTRYEFNDCNFLNYLAWKNPNLYFELELNTRDDVKLGRYTTRALVKINKENVVKNLQDSSLNKSALVREIKEFDKLYFYTFFPADIKSLNSVSDKLASILSKYPIKRRWNILSQAFKQAYNKEILDHIYDLNETLAEFFPEELKHQWAKKKYLDTNKLVYIKYYDPKIAFELLKEKINVTSNAKRRSGLIKVLFAACHKNKDYSTYEELLKYVCVRHLNDKNVHSNIMSSIQRNIDYRLLAKNHWKYINDIIDVKRITDDFYFYDCFNIIIEYLGFVCRNNLLLDGPVMQYAKNCINTNMSFRSSHWDSLKDPEVERTVLKHIPKILPELKLEDSKEATTRIMSDIVEFNRRMKKDKIFSKQFEKYCIDLNEYPNIISLVSEVFTKEPPYTFEDVHVVNNILIYNYLYSENPLKIIDENNLMNVLKNLPQDVFAADNLWKGVSEIVRKPERNDFESNLLDYFLNFGDEVFCVYWLNVNKIESIVYFSAKEPEVVAKYFNIIKPFVLKHDLFWWLDYNILKRSSHFNLDKRFVEYFRNIVLSKTTSNQRKNRCLEALSKVMETKDFLDLIQDYIPDTKKLDLTNEEQKDMYQTQCEIAKDFVNLDEPVLVAPIIMDFCHGDYLQSSLPALYRTLNRINEKEASSCINILEKGAMSTRKHAISLSFQVLPLKNAYTVYSALSIQETNISAKKYLFTAVIKYFIKNPIESLLNTVLRNIDFIDKNDTEMMEFLEEAFVKVPYKYAPLFFEKFWTVLDVLEEQKVQVCDYKFKLLNIITHDNYDVSFFLGLNENFYENLIKKHFFSKHDNLLKNSMSLNYLLAYLDETHFEFIFNILKSFKDAHWKSNNKDKVTHIFEFFSSAYEKFDKSDVKFLKLFSCFWQRLFTIEESLSEHILLRLMYLYKENTNIEIFAKEVNNLFEELTEKHGPNTIYGDFIISCIRNFFLNIQSQNKTNFDLEHFAFYLLKSHSSAVNCFIAFHIIKEITSKDKEDIYFKVVDALHAVDDFSVRIYCNILKKNEVS